MDTNTENSVISLIRTKYNTLSSAQKSIADYVLSHPQEVIMFTLHELSVACSVSEASIIRFLHKINYKSYQVFRVNIAREISRRSSSEEMQDITTDVTAKDSVADIKEKVLQHIIRSMKDGMQTISPESLEQLVTLIMLARKIVWVGMGSSSVIVKDGFHKLMKLGIDSFYFSDPHLINVIASQMQKHDLLLVVSHSGESREVLDAVALAKSGGAKIAAITSYQQSSLSRESDCVVLSSSLETKYRSDAMTSRILQLAIIDMLYIALGLRVDNAKESIQSSRIAVARKKT